MALECKTGPLESMAKRMYGILRDKLDRQLAGIILPPWPMLTYQEKMAFEASCDSALAEFQRLMWQGKISVLEDDE